MGGNLSNNSAHRLGGGVCICADLGGIFIMNGGTITSNSAREQGGGIWAGESNRTSVIKTGGTITGYSSDQNNGNVVRDVSGNIIARNGHAIFIRRGRIQHRKETTAGLGVNLSYNNESATGSWDN